MFQVPIAMEGQSVKLNSAKINTVRAIEMKEGKIVPRKGVLNVSNEKVDANSTVTPDLSTSQRPIVEKANKTIVVEPHEQTTPNLSSISTTTARSTTLHVAPVHEVTQIHKLINDTIVSKTTRKPKPKPEVTIGGKEADEPIPASPTNTSPLGQPRKIDYIVPVIITVTALPLLSVAFYVLYKRGRDYWDKRHYRRMDFLIDGMYNE